MNIPKGIADSFKTTFSLENAINYFTNPNLTVREAAEYSGAVINTVSTIYGGVKVAKGIGKGISNTVKGAKIARNNAKLNRVTTGVASGSQGSNGFIIDLQRFGGKGDKKVINPRYVQKGYKSGARSNNLFAKDKFTKKTEQLTEWRRSFNKSDISNERRLFLGDDYVKVADGKWRSLDGTRQFRVKPDDYMGKHGIGKPLVPNTPHVHLEFLKPKGNKFEVVKNIHIPLK